MFCDQFHYVEAAIGLMESTLFDGLVKGGFFETWLALTNNDNVLFQFEVL